MASAADTIASGAGAGAGVGGGDGEDDVPDFGKAAADMQVHIRTRSHFKCGQMCVCGVCSDPSSVKVPEEPDQRLTMALIRKVTAKAGEEQAR